jgi:ParB/RepB/Spo0J family partition protein
MEESIQLLEIAKLLTSPYQGRFAEISPTDTATKGIEELAASIEKSGLVQPITVRPSGGNFEIIDGHRRVEAYKLLEKTHIEAIVKEMDDARAQIISVVLNLQRKDLKLIELAVAYQKMLDNKLFADKRALSAELGKDETYVGNVLNTLKMDPRIVEDLTQNDSVRDLKILRMIRKAAPVDANGASDAQWALFTKVKTEGLSRETLATYLKTQNQSTPKAAWEISQTTRLFHLKFATKGLSEEQKQILAKSVSDKIKELGY